MGVDIGTRNLGICTLDIRSTEPLDFDVHQWLTVDLGGGRVEDSVTAMVALFRGAAVDTADLDACVIEAQLGGKFGNPTMKAVSHALQATVLSVSGAPVEFLNSKAKFSTFKSVAYPHSAKCMTGVTRSKRSLMTKENAIILATELLRTNSSQHAAHFAESFADSSITKHKRKDLADSFGLCITFCKQKGF